MHVLNLTSVFLTFSDSGHRWTGGTTKTSITRSPRPLPTARKGPSASAFHRGLCPWRSEENPRGGRENLPGVVPRPPGRLFLNSEAVRDSSDPAIHIMHLPEPLLRCVAQESESRGVPRYSLHHTSSQWHLSERHGGKWSCTYWPAKSCVHSPPPCTSMSADARWLEPGVCRLLLLRDNALINFHSVLNRYIWAEHPTRRHVRLSDSAGRPARAFCCVAVLGLRAGVGRRMLWPVVALALRAAWSVGQWEARKPWEACLERHRVRVRQWDCLFFSFDFLKSFFPLYMRRFLKFVFDVALVKLRLELQYYAQEDPRTSRFRWSSLWRVLGNIQSVSGTATHLVGWCILHEPQQSSLITVSKAVLHSSRCMGPA